MDNLVSVIIPTYKRAERLTKAISSVLNQSYKNIEIIVVDDNNPNTEFRENTELLMSNFDDNEKVFYIKHDKNRNGAAARNTGIRAAKGEFIAFLDDDDLFLETKIEKQVQYLLDNINYDAVYCGRIQKNKEVIGEYEGDLSLQILTMSFSPTTPALLFRASVLNELNGFDENFKRHQDFELLLRFFKHHKIGVIKEALVEIGENEGENALYGDNLEKLKLNFLKQFESVIDRLSEEDKNIKKDIYIANYRAVFCNHVHHNYYKNAINVYFMGCKISFCKFHFSLFKQIIQYTHYRINKLIKLNRKCNYLL